MKRWKFFEYSVLMVFYYVHADVPISSIKNNSSSIVTFARPVIQIVQDEILAHDDSLSEYHLLEFVAPKQELVPREGEELFWYIPFKAQLRSTLIITGQGIFYLEEENNYVYIRKLTKMGRYKTDVGNPRKSRFKISDGAMVRIVIKKKGNLSVELAN